MKNIYNLRLTKYTNPIYLESKDMPDSESLLSNISSCYSFPANSELLLIDFENKDNIINLSKSNGFDSVNFKTIQVAFTDSQHSAEIFNKNVNEQFNNGLADKSCKEYIVDYVKDMKVEEKNIFLIELFTIILVDHIKKKPNKFNNSIGEWLSEFDFVIVAHSFIHVLCKEFADKLDWLQYDIVKEEEKAEVSEMLKSLCKHVINLYLKESRFASLPREILSPFKSTAFGENVLNTMLDIVHERTLKLDSKLLLSRMFSDNFVFNIFSSDESFSDWINIDINQTTFPFLYIKYLVHSYLHGNIGISELSEIMKMFINESLICSCKLANSIIYPILDMLFEEIHIHDDPLNLNKEVSVVDIFKKLVKKCELMFDDYITPHHHIQYKVLLCIQKYMLKRSFFPSGICYLFFNYFMKNHIVSQETFNRWVDDTSNDILGKDSVLLEISSSVLTNIPKTSNLELLTKNALNEEMLRYIYDD